MTNPGQVECRDASDRGYRSLYRKQEPNFLKAVIMANERPLLHLLSYAIESSLSLDGILCMRMYLDIP